MLYLQIYRHPTKNQRGGMTMLFDKIKSIMDEVFQENKKLKQTLAEIKEIVGIGLVDGLQPEEYSGFLKILQAQILQKISECEVGDGK